MAWMGSRSYRITGLSSLARNRALSPTALSARRRGRASSGRSYGSLADEYQRQMDEAKAANERRYQDILGGYEDRYATAMSDLEGLGAQQRADLGQQFDELGARQQQNLAARGLAGTTLAPTLAQGLATRRSEAMTRLNEALKRERLGYQTGLSEDTLRFKERRTDAYPDLNQLQQLAYMRGQGQGSRGSGRSYGGALANARGWSGALGNRKGVNFLMPGVGVPQPTGNVGINLGTPPPRRSYGAGGISLDRAARRRSYTAALPGAWA